MKNIKRSIFGIITISLLASCSASGPLMVTNNTANTKRGEASRKIIFNITFGHTDLGAITAAKAGKITKIATVDSKIKGGLFSATYSTIVTGE
jgi:hypothetical protein